MDTKGLQYAVGKTCADIARLAGALADMGNLQKETRREIARLILEKVRLMADKGLAAIDLFEGKKGGDTESESQS